MRALPRIITSAALSAAIVFSFTPAFAFAADEASGQTAEAAQEQTANTASGAEQNPSTSQDDAAAKKKAAAEAKYRKTLDYALHVRCQKTLKKITSKKKSKAKQLKDVWNYTTSRSRWSYRIYDLSLSDKTWAKRYAYGMLANKKGDCYGFAVTFAALATEIGYKAEVITCRVPGSRDGAADGYTRHGLVRINGKLYDPEAQWAGWAPGIYGTTYYPMGMKAKKSKLFSKYKGDITPRTIYQSAASVVLKPVAVKTRKGYKGYRNKTRSKTISGTWVIGGKLYKFSKKGNCSKKTFKKYKRAAKYGTDYSKLRVLMGKPKSTKRSASCYKLGEGDDYTYTYAHVKIVTFKPHDGGPEIFLSAQAR